MKYSVLIICVILTSILLSCGDWHNAPENSIPAITNCVEMGADMVEIDIRKTKDKQFV